VVQRVSRYGALLLSLIFWSLEPVKLESDCFRWSEVETFLVGGGYLFPSISTYWTTWVEYSIISSGQLSCSCSLLRWLSCSKYFLGHFPVQVQNLIGEPSLPMSLAARRSNVSSSRCLALFDRGPCRLERGRRRCLYTGAGSKQDKIGWM